MRNSGAYFIYQKVILALIVSLILPFVFYIILRSLIDNNLDKMKNILPRLLLTALFVYFSFTVAGMIIDQSNIFSLKVASTLNRSGQPLSDMINRIILQNDPSVNFSDASNAPPQSSSGTTLYWGNPSTIPVYIIQVVITGAAIIVFFQAATLIFARALVLLLCLIFSPIMLLPSGINKKIDEYREKIITNFTNNVILAPIFLLLVLIAIKIGQVGRSLIDQAGSIQTTGIDGAMIGSALSGVISVAVLMLAIKFAKQLSGDIGNNISGRISAFTGKLALGGLSMVAKGAVNSVAKSERFKGWVEKGGRGGRLAYNTMNRLQNSTFDLRNNETFKKATGGSFGRGTNLSAEDTYNRKYNKERKYHNLLNEEGKERHLGRLDTSIAYSSIARDLRGKKELSFEEDLKSNNKFNQSFDKANSEADKDKREKKITEEIDKHFKENGKGDKHFSKELAKPENAALLQKFKDANKETDEVKRKTELLKVIKEFEDKSAKQTQSQSNTQSQANTSNNRTGVIAGTSNAQAITKNKLQRSNLDRERSLNAKAYADELAKVLKPIIGEYKKEQTGRESFFNTAATQNDKATEKAINRNRRNNNQNPNPTSNSTPNSNSSNTLNNAA